MASSYPMLRYGSSGQEVRRLQQALNRAGYSPCVVLLQNGALTVIVASADMTAEASAAILSLCIAHTDIGVENIRIMARESL